jgi:anthranilate/para-aminobenzoate synthase component II
MRYHSLIGNSENFPHEHLEITAETTKDKLIMGIKHREFEIHGIQFHPESIGTKDGKKMIENFLKLIP